MKGFITHILWRNSIRLLLVFLAVALLTGLVVWRNHRPESKLIMDCGRVDPDGKWVFAVPCE